MLAALLVFVSVGGAFLYNLNRIVRIGERETEWHNGNYGYIVGAPMFLVTCGALAVCWFFWWSGENLSGEAIAGWFVGTGFGLYFGPLVLGLIIRGCTNKHFPVNGTKDFD